MKIKNNKKIFKIICYVFLIIGSIGFVHFPSTYSYFSRAEDTSLVYQSQLYNLYDELSMNLNSASVQMAKFSFSFKPSGVLEKDETDSYEVVIPDACIFDRVVPASSSTVTESSTHSRTISYAKDTNRDTENYVYISCLIDKSTEVVDFSSTVTATINEINQKFIYKKYSYKESYEEYLERVNEMVDSSDPMSGDNLYQKFLNWISTYSQKVGYKEAIQSYLTKVYTNESALKNPNNFNALEGFSIEYDKSTDKYTFKVLSNFVGYARTYYGSLRASGKLIDIYFSTNTKVRLNQALRYYLNAYVYPDSPTSATLVYDYISNNGGIYPVILSGSRITGMTLGGYDASTLSSTVTINRSLILSMALSAKEKMPCIPFSDYNTMLSSNFRNALTLTASAMGISTDMAKVIFGRADIAASVTKNNTSMTPKSFVDYFVQQDGNRYLVIKVSSDITKDPLYNRVSIKPLSVPSAMGITFTNTDTSLQVRITHTTKSSVLKTVSDLNAHFGSSITEANLTVVADTDSEYTVEYTISK